MKKTIITLLIALFIFPVVIFAEDNCDASEIVKYKTAASKVEAKLAQDYYSKMGHSDDTDVDYEIKVPYFKIVMTNLTDDLNFALVKDGYFLWDSTIIKPTDKSYTYDVLDSYDNIRTVTLLINASKCDNMEVRKIDIKIPMLNPYRGLSKCSDIKDFYLCQDFWYQNYSTSNFNKELERYRNKQVDEQGKKITKKNFFQKLIDFSNKYYVALIIALVLVGGAILATYIIRKVRLKKHFG